MKVMKDLVKEDFKLVEEFINEYRDILEDILISSDVKSLAQQTAWKDWATEILMERASFTKQKAEDIIKSIDINYKLKII